MPTHDVIDLDILNALCDDPRASFVALADRLGLSRNTVQARMTRLENEGAFLSFDRQVEPAPLGYPLSAFIGLTITQKQLPRIVEEVGRIPEVLQLHGLSGSADLLAFVVCTDAADLFRIDALILGIDGVERTETSLSMGELIPFRIQPLIQRVKDGGVGRSRQRG